MTTGSDSLPLVSYSDTYPPLRNRNNSSYVEGPRWVTAGRDSGSGGLTTLRDGRELAVIECKVTCSRDSKGRAPSLGASDKPEPGDVSARHQGHTSVKSRVAPKIHSAP